MKITVCTMNDRRFRFSIDRGGTFTDIYCEVINNVTGDVIKTLAVKLLSEDPTNYNDAPTEGIRRIMQSVLTEKKELVLFLCFLINVFV